MYCRVVDTQIECSAGLRRRITGLSHDRLNHRQKSYKLIKGFGSVRLKRRIQSEAKNARIDLQTVDFALGSFWANDSARLLTRVLRPFLQGLSDIVFFFSRAGPV